MNKLAFLLPVLLLLSVGGSGCSDPTGIACTSVEVELQASFSSYYMDGETIYFEYGDTYERMLEAGGECELLKVIGTVYAGWPLEIRHYNCTVCLEAYYGG